MTLRITDTQYNNAMLYAECRLAECCVLSIHCYAEGHYAECRYAECRGAIWKL